MNTRREHEWISHRYFRTYEIARRISGIASDPFAYIRDLEELMGDDGIVDFLPPWQYDTVVHRFARWIADEMFLDDTAGPYVTRHDLDSNPITVKRYLPVDLCLAAYDLWPTIDFEVPERGGDYVIESRNIRRWQESAVVEDRCYDYFINSVQLSAPYEKLLDIIADEVFHVVFHNRAVMFGLNDFLARLVSAIDSDKFADDSELASLISKNGGSLRRVTPKAWARKAVFFRDQGRCVYCGVDLSGLLSTLSPSHFDHIVPLAHGGLNDVTNLQLLCKPCNLKKSAIKSGTSNWYPRLYARPRSRHRS